jgi:MerR family transcriptional regulator, heat shock protein HspR
MVADIDIIAQLSSVVNLWEEFALVTRPEANPDRPVYGISVAAELVGADPQSLRLYEARGLLSPARSGGGTRRYSSNDLARLREIGRLLEAGLNLAGIYQVLELQAANELLRQELDRHRDPAKGRRRR